MWRKFRSLYRCKKFWMWYHRTCSHPPTSCKCHAFTAYSFAVLCSPLWLMFVTECLPREVNPIPGQESISSWPGWVRDISPWLFIKVPPSRTLIWSRFPIQKWTIQSSFMGLELFMALYYQCIVTPKSSLDFRHYLAFNLYYSQPEITLIWKKNVSNFVAKTPP